MTTNYPDLSQLSVNQLLAMTIRESIENPVINEITARYPSLKELTEATFAELTQIKGIGPRKASAILASIELAKRLNAPAPEQPMQIISPKDVVNLVTPEMRYLDRECFKVILLNTKNHVIRIDTVSIGTLNFCAIHPREVFKSAIKHSAGGIILVHNHPSGDCSPSQQDLDITKRLVEAGKLIGIEVMDHVIIGGSGYTSFKERGLLI